MQTKVEPFVIVIIGAAGDLSTRKLMPALSELELQGWFPKDYAIIATSRGEREESQFLGNILTNIPINQQENFKNRLIPLTGVDFANDITKFKDKLNELPFKRRLFYAATPPNQFAVIAKALAENNLILDDSPLILEKPLGSNLASYLAINEEVAKYVPEELTFRIDHYLGKETVQNLLCLRFANLLFESVWNRSFIDHVQITVAETIGVEDRAGYYDSSGAIRDMVQNHLMQLLCLTAMEAPRSYEPDAVRDEKLKVLQSLEPIMEDNVVRGQYANGVINNEKVNSYVEDLQEKSNTETFVALKVGINNWRWAGVPFYLRTGKRLPVRESQIVVRFKNVPHKIFPDTDLAFNQFIIRLQPNEGVELQINNKIPGPGGLRLEPKILKLNLYDSGKPLPDAYERLLLDALRLNQTLYMRHDEVKASWTWIDSLLSNSNTNLETYNSGTWGPDLAQILLANDNRRWVNPQ